MGRAGRVKKQWTRGVNNSETLDYMQRIYRWDPRDGASRPVDHRECDQQSAIVVDCRPHLPRLPSPPGAVNNRRTAVAVYIAFANGRRAVANFSKSRFLDKLNSRGKYPYFGDTLISLKHSEGKPV